MKKKTIKHI